MPGVEEFLRIQRGHAAKTGRGDGLAIHPVSYTHLDVYKRQVQASGGSAVAVQDVPHAQTGSYGIVATDCLLYTSRCV